jgi:hypothetical protein
MNKLLQFLFHDSQEEQDRDSLAEDLAAIFEGADEVESIEAKKSPLIKALKSLDISTSDEYITVSANGVKLTCDSPEDYFAYKAKLLSPDGLHSLATEGWVPLFQGDDQPSTETGNLSVTFIPIDTADDDNLDKDKVDHKALEKISKDSQELGDAHDSDTESEEVDYDIKPKKYESAEDIVDRLLEVSKKKK